MDKDQDPAAVLDTLLVMLPEWAAQSLKDAQAALNEETARFYLGRRDGLFFVRDWIQKADVPPSTEPKPIAPYQQRGITPPQADPGETRLTAATADLDRHIHAAVLAAGYRAAGYRAALEQIRDAAETADRLAIRRLADAALTQRPF